MKMRAVQVAKTQGTFELVEREIPEADAGAVRVKVEACGICPSDWLVKEGSIPGIQYPRMTGREDERQGALPCGTDHWQMTSPRCRSVNAVMMLR